MFKFHCTTPLTIFLDVGQTTTTCCRLKPLSIKCVPVELPYLQQFVQQLQGLQGAGLGALHRQAQPLHQGQSRLCFASPVQPEACCSEFGRGGFENYLTQQRTQPRDAAHGQEELQHLQTMQTTQDQIEAK